MGAAYSQDLRDRVLAAGDRGMPTKQVADVFAVSPPDETGEAAAAGARRDLAQALRRAHPASRSTASGSPSSSSSTPDATLKELRAMLGVDCAESAVCTALKKLGFTFKKRRSTRRSRTGPTSPSDASAGGTSSQIMTPAG